MANKLKGYYKSKRIKSWKQLYDYYESRFFNTGERWVFRGQKEKIWGLKSSLERELENFDIDLCHAAALEQGLLRKFKRQCHHYISDAPKDNDTLEWLALMQHYGGPTRLLDWTYSFFAALFFAIETANKKTTDKEIKCSVWAINTDWLGHPFNSVLQQHPDVLRIWVNDKAVLQAETFNSLFIRQPYIEIVGAVNPRRLNKRLTIQQGVFLCAGNVCKSFEDNLIATLSNCRAESKANFIKINIEVSLEMKKEILLKLQSMNMNTTTLFPGLEGFAQSLKSLMVAPDVLLHPGEEEI